MGYYFILARKIQSQGIIIGAFVEKETGNVVTLDGRVAHAAVRGKLRGAGIDILEGKKRSAFLKEHRLWQYNTGVIEPRVVPMRHNQSSVEIPVMQLPEPRPGDPCSTCGGSGLQRFTTTKSGGITKKIPCGDCAGTGRVQSFNKAPAVSTLEGFFGPTAGMVAADGPDVEGIMISGSGMKGRGYTGAFVTDEENFIRTVIYLKNQETVEGRALPFDVATKRLANGKDLHLFCGRSDFCTTRIDANRTTNFRQRIKMKEPIKKVLKSGEVKEEWFTNKYTPVETAATVVITVQKFINQCVNNGTKFDLILFDPPYNDKFNKEYGTKDANPLGVGAEFIAQLVDDCLKIINPGGVIISKNWRSIRNPQSRFVGGEATIFGGTRRFTMVDAWQYKPKKPLIFTPDIFRQLWGDVDVVPWFVGAGPGQWSQRELQHMQRYTNINKTLDGIVITDNLETRIGNCVPITPDMFLGQGTIHDVIIVDEYRGFGGDNKKTSKVKRHVVDESREIVNRVAKDGYVFTKAYFKTSLDGLGLDLLETNVVTYDNFNTSDIFQAYHKPLVAKQITENPEEEYEEED